MKKLITRQELADRLGLHRKTIWKDIKEAGIDIPKRKRLNSVDVKKILDFYGIEEDEPSETEIKVQKKTLASR